MKKRAVWIGSILLAWMFLNGGRALAQQGSSATTAPATTAAAATSRPSSAFSSASSPVPAKLPLPLPLPPGMEDFKTVDTCQTAAVVRNRPEALAGESGYLGLTVEARGGQLVVIAVAPDSPAAKAGMAAGDSVADIDGHVPGDADDWRDLVQAIAPGTLAHINAQRDGKPLPISALISAVSRPMSLTAPNDRPVLGVRLTDDGGARIASVDSGSPASRAGLRPGDLITKVDDIPLGDAVSLQDVLANRKINDKVSLAVTRDGNELTLPAQLGSAQELLLPQRGFGNGAGRGGGLGGNSTYFDRVGQLWRRDVLKLAIVGIEFPDVKHNDKIPNKAWEDALFSHGTYHQTATGQQAFGSEYDYYQEQSYGWLKVQGVMLPWVTVGKERADYSQGTGTGPTNRQLLTDAIAVLQARDGRGVLEKFDAIIFIYAGPRVQTTRGGIFWPHKSQVPVGQLRMQYVIIPEGGPRMTDISVLCHETGHILGLPDLYAQPENPGSEGLGVWCVMSQQNQGGRPQDMSAWCKEQLGWIKPAVIDPAVKQKLVLAPIEDSAKECYKILIKADGSEYFLLENRKRQGFDANLPAEGLLIYRVVNNRPTLEESHGVEGPSGPQVFLSAVPFPSIANDSFTPFTTPSSRSKLGGGKPVWLTNIKRMADGRISFWIGYEFN